MVEMLHDAFKDFQLIIIIIIILLPLWNIIT